MLAFKRLLLQVFYFVAFTPMAFAVRMFRRKPVPSGESQFHAVNRCYSAKDFDEVF